MKKKILIFGAGGHAIKVTKIAMLQNYSIVGYVSTENPGTIVNGLPILGYIGYYKDHVELHDMLIHIGIGENSVRYEIFRNIGDLSKNIVSVISNLSLISEDASIGIGCFIAQGAVVQNNVKIGKCCIIDTGAIVDHDTIVGDFVTISPNSTICSKVIVGNGAIIGAGSVIIEKVKIGDNSLIGAGSVVIKDVPSNVVVVGNPARILRKREFSERYFK